MFVVICHSDNGVVLSIDLDFCYSNNVFVLSRDYEFSYYDISLHFYPNFKDYRCDIGFVFPMYFDVVIINLVLFSHRSVVIVISMFVASILFCLN